MANSMKKGYPKMERANRAKQFMPFDALKGFREALAEKERVLTSKKELPEEQKANLDFKLQQIRERDTITVEYFHNGEYVTMTGVISKIDEYRKIFVIADVIISFDDIAALFLDRK